MKYILRFILLAGLILLGLWAWSVFFPNPATVIHRRLVQLSRLAAFSGNEGNITAGVNAERIGAFFAEDIKVNVDVPGIETATFVHREDLQQAALAARSSGVSVSKLKFQDINITVSPDGQSATADLTLEAAVSTQRDPIVQELKFTLNKVDRDWLITEVDTVKTLK
jgi:hypothetical protein